MSDLILRRVCKIARISVEDLRGPDVSPSVAYRRNYVAHVLSERGWSSLKIGLYLNRDHTSILHALKRFPVTCYTWHNPVKYPRQKRAAARMAAE